MQALKNKKQNYIQHGQRSTTSQRDQQEIILLQELARLSKEATLVRLDQANVGLIILDFEASE